MLLEAFQKYDQGQLLYHPERGDKKALYRKGAIPFFRKQSEMQGPS